MRLSLYGQSPTALGGWGAAVLFAVTTVAVLAFSTGKNPGIDACRAAVRADADAVIQKAKRENELVTQFLAYGEKIRALNDDEPITAETNAEFYRLVARQTELHRDFIRVANEPLPVRLADANCPPS